MKKFMNKRPPEPFFGPDDYIGGSLVIDDISAVEARIMEWVVDYHRLSLWDKIRLFFSDSGCVVSVRES